MRFAFSRLAPFMKDLGKAVLPTGPELAMSVLPDLIFSGVTAASMPEGTDWTTRLGAAGEDLAAGLLTGTFGRAGGYTASRGLGKLKGSPLSDNWRHLITNAGEIGTQAALYPLTPRPFAAKAYEEYNQREMVSQEEAQAEQDEMVRQRALLDAHALGFQSLPALQQAYLAGSVGGYG
jgi:hypothetical protein